MVQTLMPPSSPPCPLLITSYLTPSPPLLIYDITDQHVLRHFPFGFDMKLEQLFQFPRLGVLLLYFINVASQGSNTLLELDSAVLDLVNPLAQEAKKLPSRGEVLTAGTFAVGVVDGDVDI